MTSGSGIRLSIKSCGRKGGQVVIGLASFDDGRHDFRSDGREEDAVAEVAGGDVVARSGCLAKDRQRIGSSGAKSGPAFQDSCVGKSRHQSDGRLMQALNGCEVSALIESSFFDSSADEEAAVAARDEVGLRRADDMFQERARRHYQTEHLAFDRASGELVRSDLARPGSGTVNYFVAVKCGLRGFDASGTAVVFGHGSD